ncbi:aspartic proteinase NANA, chloroplast-like [Rosa sericea]
MMKGRMSTSSTTFLFIIFLLSATHHGLLHVCANGDHTTMRLPLIHKYSPHFNGGVGLINKTDIDIMKELYLQDIIRHQMIFQMNRDDHQIPRREDSETNSSFAMPVHSGFDILSGLYWVEVKIGTPPKTFLLAADTGSDLTWVKCKYDRTLTKEAKQKMIDDRKKKKHHHGDLKKSLIFLNKGREFRADLSSTFKPVPCSDGMCSKGLAHMMSYKDCPTPTSPCKYTYRYMGGEGADGFFGYDTITVPLANGSKTKLPNVTIGCTDSSQKLRQGDGILGLGFGDYSFSETVVSYKFSGKFSYCLMFHRSNSSVLSYLTFGPNKQTVNSPMRYTKLVMRKKNGEKSAFYGVNITGISIGGTLLKIPSQFWDATSSNGGVVLDSGSTNTFLPLPAYKAVMDELTVPLSKYDYFAIKDLPFDFCFNDTGYDESSVPRLAYHFADGVRFEPPVRNYVVPVTQGTKCLGFIPSPDGKFVIGNQMQQNHLWEFDISRGTVGFAPSSCT